MKLSFVIPCYRSEHTLEGVVGEIHDKMKERPSLEYEIILVNDCSPDGVQSVIERLCAESPSTVHGIELARNFGQHSAILAGCHYITGDFVYAVDDDGQTPIESTFVLLDKLEEGYDIVWGAYEQKKHSLFRNFGSRVNGWMAEKLVGKPHGLQVTSFRVARRFVIDEAVRYDGAYPYLLGLLLRSTKRVANVPVEHRSRKEGRSGYTFAKLFGLWMNGFTAFSVEPLRLATWGGFACSGIGFLAMLFVIVRKLLNPHIALGYSSLMAVILFVGGVQMVMTGMLGEYIGRIYICQNKAPQFVIRKKIGL